MYKVRLNMSSHWYLQFQFNNSNFFLAILLFLFITHFSNTEKSGSQYSVVYLFRPCHVACGI